MKVENYGWQTFKGQIQNVWRKGNKEHEAV